MIETSKKAKSNHSLLAWIQRKAAYLNNFCFCRIVEEISFYFLCFFLYCLKLFPLLCVAGIYYRYHVGRYLSLVKGVAISCDVLFPPCFYVYYLLVFFIFYLFTLSFPL